MMTLKTRCDAKNVLRCSPVDDVADVASDVGVAEVGNGPSASVGDASPKYNIGQNTARGAKKYAMPAMGAGTHCT
ncbi:unnamed protein product [Heligmosomoides polygyrus]|uniref:SCP domain-containing protein n=1 Tax=Heligmosomoides polygyrus TaxID=6339 RepID=A0A183FZN4_HELPZ|nr:unnamed protein product [Heligmosomoides polygyrus]